MAKLVNFGVETAYGQGSTPSVAVNSSGVVVEVHEEKGSSLWYHVGRLNESKSITWGKSIHYDSGKRPRVAIDNDGYVVEVHQSQSYSTLWYHVGKVNVETNSINWGLTQSQKYDDGERPAVAINDNGKIVVVHETSAKLSFFPMFYRTGDIDKASGRIQFNQSVKYGTGRYPAVTMNKSGKVLAIHNDVRPRQSGLWYYIGTLSGDRVNFGQSNYYNDGDQPSVALINDGQVITAHRYGNELMFHPGTLSDSTLLIGDGRCYQEGVDPSVAAAILVGSAHLVEVHAKSSSLYFHSIHVPSIGGHSPSSNQSKQQIQAPSAHVPTKPTKTLEMRTLQLITWTDDQGQQQRYKLAQKVSSRWRDFGIRINLEPDILDGWNTANQANAQQCWMCVMKAWREGQGGDDYPFTWDGLYELLKDLNFATYARDLQEIVN